MKKGKSSANEKSTNNYILFKIQPYILLKNHLLIHLNILLLNGLLKFLTQHTHIQFPIVNALPQTYLPLGTTICLSCTVYRVKSEVTSGCAFINALKSSFEVSTSRSLINLQ